MIVKSSRCRRTILYDGTGRVVLFFHSRRTIVYDVFDRINSTAPAGEPRRLVLAFVFTMGARGKGQASHINI